MIVPAGDIKDMTVPWLFHDLRKENQSGTVSLAREHALKKIYFKGGEIISAASNVDSDQLGACLLRDGKITQQYYDATNEIVQKTGKDSLAVLVEYEFITQQELTAGAALLAKQVVLSVFGWRDGHYIFDNSPQPLSGITPLSLNTNDMIIEGIRGLDWQAVRKSLPSLKTILRPTTDQSLLVLNARLEQDYHTVFSLIDGNKSIEEICSLSGIGDFNALKAVYMLLALKMAEKGEVKSEAEIERIRKATRAEAAKEQKKTEQAQETTPEGDTAPVTKQTIEQAYEALRHQDNYQVLGLPDSATAQDIKKAYFRLAKVYHPDRHLGPEMIVMKEKLESLFTAISGAYQALSDAAKRREYDQMKTQRQRDSQFAEKRPEEYVENYAEKSGRATAYFSAGMKDFKTGNFWGAAESFAWATRLDPVKSDYFYQYGLTLARIPRRMHEAEENLQKAIEIDPLRPEYYVDLGNIYVRSGQTAKALAIYDKALQGNPDSEKIKEAIKAAGGTVPEEQGDAGLFNKMFKDKK